MHYTLLIISILWPLIYMYPANNGILTLSFYVFDSMQVILKCNKMVQSEYILLTGSVPNTSKVKTWLYGIVLCKFLQNTAAWFFVASVHLYSPLFKHIYNVYLSAMLYAGTEYTYQTYYKKWVLTYGVILSDDTDLSPGLTGQ